MFQLLILQVRPERKQSIYTLIWVDTPVAGHGGSSAVTRVANNSLVPAEQIQSRILVLRGQRVLLDRDLARLYGVTTSRLNEQVRRNRRKFPEDFMFQLAGNEATQVFASRSQNAILNRGQNVKYLPFAFTEHGAIQAANILSSDAATEMSVHVVRAFVRLRQLMVNHRALSAKLAELDARVGSHDEQLAALVAAIRQLTTPDAPNHGRKIGFHRSNR